MIRLEHVSFRYQASDADVLNDVSLHVNSGEVVSLLGPSGCGKSTLMYVCGLLLTPRAGRVLIDDVEASDLGDTDRSRVRAQDIGFVFQDAMLDTARSVLANVAEGAAYSAVEDDEIRRRALALCEEFGLRERMHARAADLSGGQAQRVALCRALVKRPRIILADEPSGNLDPGNGRLVLDHLRGEARERDTAVLVVTHDDRMAERCDRIVQFAQLARHDSETIT